MRIKAASRIKDVSFNEYLAEYLEGDRVPDSWVTEICGLLDKGPSILYRLMLTPIRLKIGQTIRLNKKLVSVSDRIENAIYAGSSYHHDMNTDLKNQSLVLVEIHDPHVYMSYKTLRNIFMGNSHVLPRLDKEREYLIDGQGQKATVKYITRDTYFITNRDYKLLSL